MWGAAHNDVGRVREAARGYVFSESDEFVDWRAVEEHAGMAVEKGFVVVRRERYVLFLRGFGWDWLIWG